MCNKLNDKHLPNKQNYDACTKFAFKASHSIFKLLRWNFYVCSKYLARSNSAPNFSIVSLCIMQLCIPHRLSIICAQKWVIGGFESELVKLLCFDPQKALPYVKTRPLVYLVSKSVQWPELYVGRKILRTKKELNKNWVVTLAIWGDLDQTWRVGRYGRRNHVRIILWLSVKGCGCGERGKFAFSHWLEVSLLQHWSHYRDRLWTIATYCRPVASRILGDLRGPQNSLCRLHTWSRVSVGQNRLSALAMLHDHYKIDLLEVVDKFSKKHPRRMQLDSMLLHWLWNTGIIQVLDLTILLR